MVDVIALSFGIIASLFVVLSIVMVFRGMKIWKAKKEEKMFNEIIDAVGGKDDIDNRRSAKKRKLHKS